MFTNRSSTSTSQRGSEDTSYAYSQRKRAERIFGVVGSADYANLNAVDTAVLLALNYYSKPEGSGMRPSIATLTLMTNLSRSSVLRALSRLVNYDLLKVDAEHQRRGVVVCYRFGDALLERGDKLREMLERKQTFRTTTHRVGVSRRRHPRVAARPPGSCELVTGTLEACHQATGPESHERDGSVTATATSISGPHRSDLEPTIEQTTKPILELTPAVGAPRPLDGASHRLATSVNQNQQEPLDTLKPKVPESDDEIAAFFENAFASKNF